MPTIAGAPLYSIKQIRVESSGKSGPFSWHGSIRSVVQHGAALNRRGVDMSVLRSNRMSEEQVNRFYRDLLDEQIAARVVPLGATEFYIELDAVHHSKAIVIGTRILGDVAFSH